MYECPMWFDEQIEGTIFLRYKRPCIYAWMREEECLYVGMSINGLERPISYKHHVIGRTDQFLPTDRLKLFFPPVKNAQELASIETLYIHKLNPKYNEQRNGNTVSELHDPLFTKEKVAEILFHKVPKRTVLENPQSCSDRELEEFLEQELEYQQAKKMGKNLGLIN